MTAGEASSAAWAIGLLVGVNLVFFGTRALVAAGVLDRLSPRRDGYESSGGGIERSRPEFQR